jgi:hypothetical protein
LWESFSYFLFVYYDGVNTTKERVNNKTERSLIALWQPPLRFQHRLCQKTIGGPWRCETVHSHANRWGEKEKGLGSTPSP